MTKRKPTPEPWERQHGEGFKAFAAFDCYLSEHCTTKVVASKLSRSSSQILQWWKRWR